MDDSTPLQHPRRWTAFAVVLGVSLLDLIDSTVTNVAAPTIRGDLGGGESALLWISAAYTVAMAIGLLTGGRLGDRFGRRRMLLVGLSGFVGFSAVCALAPSVEVLVGGRALQGLFGAMMLPQTFGLLRDLFGREVHKAFAILGPACGLAAVLGPILAGVVIDVDAWGTDWRGIFLINLPVGAALLVAGRALLPGNATDATVRVDAGGTALAAAGVFAIVIPLVNGPAHPELGWPAWSLVMLAAGPVLLALFARHQVTRKRAAKPTLIEPSAFTKRAFAGGIAFAVLFLSAMGGTVLTLNVYLQAGLGFSAMHAVAATAAWPLGGFAGAALAGTLGKDRGRLTIHLGVATMAAGLLLTGGTIADAGTGIGIADLVLPLLIAGMGMGAIFVPMFDTVAGGLDPHEVGSGSAILQSTQQLGMSIGIAAMGTVFFDRLAAADATTAATTTAVASAGILVLAFAVAFLLPRDERPAARPQPATA